MEQSRLAGENLWVLGAFAEEELVGMAGLHRSTRLKMRHKAEIWGMFVAPEQQGLGLGRTLLEAVIELARSTPGIEQLLLTVAAYNEPAKKLYESLGFEAWGLEPRAVKYAGQYYDDVQMCLMLE